MTRPPVNPSTPSDPRVDEAIRAEAARLRSEHRAERKKQRRMLRHGRKSALKVVRRLLRGLNNRKVSWGILLGGIGALLSGTGTLLQGIAAIVE